MLEAFPSRFRLSPARRARLVTGVFWVMVAGALPCSALSLFLSLSPAKPVTVTAPAPTGAVGAAGYAQMQVLAFLAAARSGETPLDGPAVTGSVPSSTIPPDGPLAAALGVAPLGSSTAETLPGETTPATGVPAVGGGAVGVDGLSATAVSVVEAGSQYWAVTVAVTGPAAPDQAVRYYRLAVAGDSQRPGFVEVGSPAVVAAPEGPPPPALATAPVAVPDPADPMAVMVHGFLQAYLCGTGDLSRYLAAGVHAVTVSPSVCSELAVTGLSSTSTGPGAAVVTVSVRATQPGRAGEVWGYSLAVTKSPAGQLIVTRLLPGPPLAGTNPRTGL